MSPEKLAGSGIRDGTLTPYGSARRNFENSATAAREAISAARFGPKLANTQQPAKRSCIALLKNDAHFIFWHRGNRTHI
jgi:hypothetical protein